jgi:Predicted phosphohydrolases
MAKASEKPLFDITRLQYASRLVPRALDGFLIAHVSDLHNRRFAEGPEQLAAAIRAQSPDMIAVTGDLLDRHRPDIETAMAFIRLAVNIAPVYFAPGNHEFRSGQYEALLPRLKGAGVHVLDDASEAVESNGAGFIIAGLKDPAFFNDRSGRAHRETLARREAMLRSLVPAGGNSLCCSRTSRSCSPCTRAAALASRFAATRTAGRCDCPSSAGCSPPARGFFPRYTSGACRKGDTTMIVSRGLGGRLTRLRLFNRPEVVIVSLKAV